MKTRNGRAEISKRDARQRLVHRQQAIGIAHDAALVAERLDERLPQSDADILDRMMIVDLQVALGADGQVDQRMTRDLVEHMIEKADTRLDVGFPGAIEQHIHGNLGLIGLARDSGGAHRLIS